LEKESLFFSYGSGLTSSMFSFRVNKSVEYIADRMNIENSLSQRIFVDPDKFNESLNLRERKYGKNNYNPSDGLDTLFPGTYYLEKVDNEYRNFYNRIPKNQPKL